MALIFNQLKTIHTVVRNSIYELDPYNDIAKLSESNLEYLAFESNTILAPLSLPVEKKVMFKIFGLKISENYCSGSTRAKLVNKEKK